MVLTNLSIADLAAPVVWADRKAEQQFHTLWALRIATDSLAFVTFTRPADADRVVVCRHDSRKMECSGWDGCVIIQASMPDALMTTSLRLGTHALSSRSLIRTWSVLFCLMMRQATSFIRTWIASDPLVRLSASSKRTSNTRLAYTRSFPKKIP